MTIIRKSDHKRASLTLYHVVALNAEVKLGYTINKIGAAQVLADLLQIDRRAPLSWLRGSFIKHPLSRENFLKFIRAYRTKPGLENAKKITALAISLYGSHYKRAIELLDPADREGNLAQDVMVTLPGESKMVKAIYNLLESSPEAIGIALGTMNTYQWTASVLLEKLQDVPDETEIGTDKIISVILTQFSDDQRETFSKLGGLPELALYSPPGKFFPSFLQMSLRGRSSRSNPRLQWETASFLAVTSHLDYWKKLFWTAIQSGLF
jgi:hypothetical protein